MKIGKNKVFNLLHVYKLENALDQIDETHLFCRRCTGLKVQELLDQERRKAFKIRKQW